MAAKLDGLPRLCKLPFFGCERSDEDASTARLE